MLIVTNGDSAAEKLTSLCLDADILPWRDVLHDGPVQSAPDLPTQSKARAGFLAKFSGQPEATVSQDMILRDQQWLAALGGETTILLFEHDLYDQLQLAQLLWSASRVPNLRDLRLMQSNRHLSALSNEELQRAIAGAGEHIDTATMSAAAEVWDAFTAPAPTALAVLSLRDRADLPWMAAALRRLLAEYPALGSGLPASMTYALEALRDGPLSLGQMFGQMQAKETAAFMGDWSFARLIDGLAQARVPLLAAAGGHGRLNPLPLGTPPDRAWFAQTAQLSAFGVEVLHKTADMIAVNGIERWIGGSHLTGRQCWRYVADSGALVTA